MEKKEAEETGEKCPECGNPLVVRNGKYGEFVACSNYPECKYIKKDEVETVEICSCPSCSGTIVEKKSRKGKIFYGCNQYPSCNFALWYEPTGEKCPECGSLLVKKVLKSGEKIECSSKTCKYTKPVETEPDF